MNGGFWGVILYTCRCHRGGHDRHDLQPTRCVASSLHLYAVPVLEFCTKSIPVFLEIVPECWVLSLLASSSPPGGERQGQSMCWNPCSMAQLEQRRLVAWAEIANLVSRYGGLFMFVLCARKYCRIHLHLPLRSKHGHVPPFDPQTPGTLTWQLNLSSLVIEHALVSTSLSTWSTSSVWVLKGRGLHNEPTFRFGAELLVAWQICLSRNSAFLRTLCLVDQRR